MLDAGCVGQGVSIKSCIILCIKLCKSKTYLILIEFWYELRFDFNIHIFRTTLASELIKILLGLQISPERLYNDVLDLLDLFNNNAHFRSIMGADD